MGRRLPVYAMACHPTPSIPLHPSHSIGPNAWAARANRPQHIASNLYTSGGLTRSQTLPGRFGDASWGRAT